MHYNDLPAFIPSELEVVLEKEREYHRSSKSNSSDPKLLDSASWLIDVYDNVSQFLLEEETELESQLPKLLSQRRSSAGYAPGDAAIVSRSEFDESFQKLTSGCLDGKF